MTSPIGGRENLKYHIKYLILLNVVLLTIFMYDPCFLTGKAFVFR